MSAATGEHHSSSYYVKIWAILLVLLIISVCGPYLGIKWVTLLTAFGIAIVKALMVVKHFMHLPLERKFITYLLVLMIAIGAMFYFGVAPDVREQSGTNWRKLHTVEVLPSPVEHEE